jgi:hypothetical protein
MLRYSSHLVVSAALTALVIVAFFAFSTVHRFGESNRASQEQIPPLRQGTEPRMPRETTPQGRNTIFPEEREFHPTSAMKCASDYFVAWHEPLRRTCRPAIRNGYPVPDPRCTPGGINSKVTVQVLDDPTWNTRNIRNCENSEARKQITYFWYDIVPPHGNRGNNQVCELDHLVPLALGGADGLGNIWPECGPDGVTLRERYFKAKDRVENYLAREVKAGRISLEDAQRGIARDWTQYLPMVGETLRERP